MKRFNRLSLLFVFTFLLLPYSVRGEDEETSGRRDGGFKYSGVFKFASPNSESSIDWGQLRLEWSAGPNYHRYDPFRKADSSHISVYTESSLQNALSFEWRLYPGLSLVSRRIWESQEVSRYDGIPLGDTDPYTIDSDYGAQINIEPLFFSYRIGRKSFPFYHFDSNDNFTHKFVASRTEIGEIGLRKNISDSFSMSFSIDYTSIRKQPDPILGNVQGFILGGSFTLLHNWGIGLRVREEEGEIKSQQFNYKVRAFSITPFISL